MPNEIASLVRKTTTTIKTRQSQSKTATIELQQQQSYKTQKDLIAQKHMLLMELPQQMLRLRLQIL